MFYVNHIDHLEEHSSWRKYNQGLKELELFEAPKSVIREFKYRAAQECFLAFADLQALWRQYYAAVKSGRKEQAEDILKKIHSAGRPAPRAGGCSRCRKKF